MTHPRWLPVLLAAMLLPLPALGQDEIGDLDVTMEVLDYEGEVDLLINEMRGPDTVGVDRDLGDEATGESPAISAAEREADPFGDADERRDGFGRDETLPEDELATESDFEFAEGEDVDLDELPEDDYLPDDEYHQE